MNIAEQLKKLSHLHPFKKAVTFPEGRDSLGRRTYAHLTYEALENRSNELALSLQKFNIKKGMRVLLFIPPSLDFSVIVFTLFKLGAIPIFMDPGMGRKNLFQSIKRTRPDALIAVSFVSFLSPLFPSVFKSVKKIFSMGEREMKWLNIFSLKKILRQKNSHDVVFTMENVNDEDEAAILFTSGGTGIPKGVVYTHRMFHEQIRLLKDLFQLSEADIDLPGFPLFSLFTISMGMTSCIPDMDPRSPAQCDPQKLVENIIDHGITFAGGSPAIWDRVADYCLLNKIKLPSLQKLVMFGAPVSLSLHEKWKLILINGSTYTPYGATECLPITNISGTEILALHQEKMKKGLGTCVGKPAPGMKIKILPLENSNSNNNKNSNHHIGEILVTGCVVTHRYDLMEEETKKAKIKEGNEIWHRMGDVGYLDEEGNLWFCGRKVHRVEYNNGETLFSIPVESIFNQHPLVNRSALVGLRRSNKNIVPAIVIEDKEGLFLSNENLKKDLILELKKMSAQYEQTRPINDIYFMKNFPVDIRHNIKIDRLQMRDQLEKKL